MKRNRAMPAGLPSAEECAAIKDAAAAWKVRADAGLTEPQRAELNAWLEADPRHRAALARFDSVWERLDRPFHAGVNDKLMAALNLRARRRRRSQILATVSGIVVMLAALPAWRFAGDFVSGSTKQPVAIAGLPKSAVLLMPERQILPDGSDVDLKPGAEIAVDFSGVTRRVELLKGEAHFQVKKDPTRLFVVVAGGVEAHALGTAFAVQVGARSVEVLVTEGTVAVAQAAAEALSPGAPPASAPIAVLNVSDRIVVDRVSPSTELPAVTAVRSEELDERLAWRAPQVEFTRTSLADAIAVLNGYAAGRRSVGEERALFVIGDPAIAGVRISGLFRIDHSSDAFVGLLKNGFGIEAERGNDGKILLRASAAPAP